MSITVSNEKWKLNTLLLLVTQKVNNFIEYSLRTVNILFCNAKIGNFYFQNSFCFNFRHMSKLNPIDL